MQNLIDHLKKYEVHRIESIFMVLALISLSISCILFFKSVPDSKSDEKSIKTVAQEHIINPPPQTIVVDVSGAVLKPNAYEVRVGARLKDVLTLAGGLSNNADKSFFSRNYNLSQYLADQEKIHVPTLQEVTDGIYKENYKIVDFATTVTSNSTNGSEPIIHINQDSQTALLTLKGITKTIAKKIVDNRPYSSISDLLDQKIVKQDVYDQIKQFIDL
jgi:competence protein ComEA